MALAKARGGARQRGGSRAGTLVPLVGAACAVFLVWGWSVRREVYLTAEFGAGYLLGIAGTAMMVLLLLYSLRKRLRSMRSWGRPPLWLDVHMMLGLLGPTAILFHSNFQLGSLNSTVALLCVLLVASSGIVGRLIYPKIHLGLTGRRTDVHDLREGARARRGALGALIEAQSGLADELTSLETLALAGGNGAFGASRRLAALRRRSRGLARRAGASASLRAYLDALGRVAEFRVYERLFSLWHAFHLPFCIMLFTAAAVHVVAVHMY